MRSSSGEPAPISEDALRYADQVRSPEDLQRLSDFNRRIYLPLMLSAILPIIVAASSSATDSWVSIVVNVVAWIVFIVDLVVHTRLIPGYLRSKVGIFDLTIVVLTAPWFLLPSAEASQLLMIARLARLVRLVFVTKSARRAAQRLGRVGLFAAGMLLFASWMAYVAEHPTNPEFDNYRDALWWGVVTLTTVGYGDIVPKTADGRMAGVFLMVTGIATLGLISATLASLFRVTKEGATESDAAPAPSSAPAPGITSGIAADLDALRAQVDRLETLLREWSGSDGRASPPSGPGG